MPRFASVVPLAALAVVLAAGCRGPVGAGPLPPAAITKQGALIGPDGGSLTAASTPGAAASPAPCASASPTAAKASPTAKAGPTPSPEPTPNERKTLAAASAAPTPSASPTPACE